MYIKVHTLHGKKIHVPYYPNMTAGQFATQILAPAVGAYVVPETGDVWGTFLRKTVPDTADPVHDFVQSRKIIFTSEDKDKPLREILSDGDDVCFVHIGRRGDGNGSLERPSVHQLEWSPRGAN
jgi:hypothetical protein